MEKVIFSISGYLVGFLVSTLLWGKSEGAVGIIPNLRIALGSKELVLHHWMLFLLLLIFILIFRNYFSNKAFLFLLGVIIGGLHQGLTYRDWYLLLKK